MKNVLPGVIVLLVLTIPFIIIESLFSAIFGFLIGIIMISLSEKIFDKENGFAYYLTLNPFCNPKILAILLFLTTDLYLFLIENINVDPYPYEKRCEITNTINTCIFFIQIILCVIFFLYRRRLHKNNIKYYVTLKEYYKVLDNDDNIDDYDG